ncbi:tyrosine--tRNA ligase [Candidatus Woesearchaeota archaeon]|nr:tyrosine--tRNA ligase [Candidatus Woesearchaeota archaeon]
MDVEDRLNLITRNVEEVLTLDDLKALLECGVPLKHYIGFEISGNLHLGSVFMAVFKIKDFIKAGVDCSIFLADWHSWINNKLNSDWGLINDMAEYYKFVFKKALSIVGGDSEKLRFVKGSELYHNNDDYWFNVLDIAKHSTLARVLRSITIAGREEGSAVNFALLIYPLMQVADIFSQNINLAHSGMDQRKAHVIARDVALKIKNKLTFKGGGYKPIAVHHALLPGLQKPSVDITKLSNMEKKQLLSKLKMSKSVKQSAIFINDSEELVREKINKAFCIAGEVGFNPVLEWARLLVLNRKPLIVERPAKYGGTVTYESFKDLEKDFASKQLHPADLKSALSKEINELLKPLRTAVNNSRFASVLEKLDSVQLRKD